MQKSECIRIFGDSKLFDGWRETEILDAIRKTFLSDQQRMTKLLRPEFKRPKSMMALTEQWDSGVWSFGYCFYIAEATKLVLLSACPNREVNLKIVNSKKKLLVSLPASLKRHYVLFLGDICMDPEFNAPMPQGKYIGVRGSRFRWLPSVPALLILAWVAQYCEQFQNSPRIYLKSLQPAFANIARRWKPSSKYKSKLKDELRLLAGLKNT